MNEEVTLSIGEVSRATGLPSSTLRYWERCGVLPSPPRVGGQRRYEPSALERVALIELAKRLGFTLPEIRVFLSGLSESVPPPQVWEQLARRKLPEVERKVEEAQAMKLMLENGLQCECVSLQECVGWAQPDRADRG